MKHKLYSLYTELFERAWLLQQNSESQALPICFISMKLPSNGLREWSLMPVVLSLFHFSAVCPLLALLSTCPSKVGRESPAVVSSAAIQVLWEAQAEVLVCQKIGIRTASGLFSFCSIWIMQIAENLVVNIAQHIDSCFLTFLKEYVYFLGDLVILSSSQALFCWVLHVSCLAVDSTQEWVTKLANISFKDRKAVWNHLTEPAERQFVQNSRHMAMCSYVNYTAGACAYPTTSLAAARIVLVSMISAGDIKSERRKAQGWRSWMHGMFWMGGTHMSILTEERTNHLEKCSMYWIAQHK